MMDEKVIDDDTLRQSLKRRENLLYWPATILAATAYVVSFWLWPHMDLSERNMLILTWLIYGKILEATLNRRGRRRIDVDATERMRSLIGDKGTGQVRVDETLSGLDRVDWFREEDDVVVSRKALRELTPAELDFVLASTAGPTNTRTGDNLGVKALYSIPVLAVGLGIAYLLAYLHAWVFVSLTAVVFALAGTAGAAIWADTSATKDAKNRQIQADDAALKITGDLEAAESALTKAMESAIVGKAEWEARRRNIRSAAFRAGTSTLPPRGWKPPR